MRDFIEALRKGTYTTPLVVGFASFLATILVIYALLAAPIADDWVYYNYFEQGFTKYVDLAMGHTGRLFQWLLVYAGYELFGMAAVKFVPVALFVALILSIFWLIKTVKLLRGGLVAELGVSMLVACLMLFLQPSIFDTYLWLTSSTVYLASIVFLFLNATFVYILLTKKTAAYFKVLALFSLLIGQTFSEVTSIFMIGLVTVVLVLSFLCKKREYIAQLVLSWVALVSGLLIVYLSPGSIARRATSPDFDPSWVLFSSLRGYKEILFSHPVLWFVGAAILGLVLILLVDTRRVNVKPRYMALLALFIFASTTYPVFALNNYTQAYVPDRIFTLSVVGILVTVVFASIWLSKIVPVSNRWRGYAVPVLVGLMVLAIPLIGRMGAGDIARLSLRDRVTRYRDEHVALQLREGREVIEVAKAPKLLRGNADDFYYGDGQWDGYGRNWVANSYLEYMGMKDQDGSDDKVVLVDPPRFYR